MTIMALTRVTRSNDNFTMILKIQTIQSRKKYIYDIW